jgi:hypothetical protein
VKQQINGYSSLNTSVYLHASLNGALIGLYFAIHKGDYQQPVVWMLNPIERNKLSLTPGLSAGKSFGLTWINPNDEPQTLRLQTSMRLGRVEGEPSGSLCRSGHLYPSPHERSAKLFHGSR